MKTETLITKLFDFQKYEGNKRLSALIEHSRSGVATARELCDDELEIWAAGDIDAQNLGKIKKNLPENDDD